MQISPRLRRLTALLPLLLLAGISPAQAARTQAANVQPLVPLAAPGVEKAPLFVRSELVLANDGNLYFTSSAGGEGIGTVSKLTPSGTLSVLHALNDTDEGAASYGKIMQASDGNLYGTMYYGGTKDRGVVFKVTLAGTYTVLRSFGQTSKDASNPYTGLVQAADGNLYGTTLLGGAQDMGTVFRISTNGDFAIVHEFGGSDGRNPEGTLVIGADGNLYGTTLQGGDKNRGAIYRITTGGAFTLLYSFPELGAFSANAVATNATGANPRAGLLLAADGNFYGTAYQGGTNGFGTVFRITPTGTLNVVHAFTGPSFGGARPLSGLVQDTAGNFYGTTEGGGYLNSGSAYRIDPAGQFTLLHGFTGLTTDGSQPYAGLTLLDGYLYGVTTTDVFGSAGTLFRLELATAGVLPLEFSISETAITQGSSVTVSWSGPAGSTCSKVGSAWGAAQDAAAPAVSSESVTPATAGLYTYIISCTTGTVVRSAYANVVVSAPPRETVDGGGGTGALSLLPLLLLGALLSRKYFKEISSQCP
jgi:uncharacterized repeat protein (TIGR03803 family)